MDTKDEEHIWDVRKTAGMVFQNPDNQIIGNIVEEDVGFGPENIGVETKEIWKRVDESLKAVGMTAYRKQSPNKLSGGQKQRVATVSYTHLNGPSQTASILMKMMYQMALDRTTVPMEVTAVVSPLEAVLRMLAGNRITTTGILNTRMAIM